MCVVTFDPAAFVVRYPEFQPIAAPVLQRYFDEATLYLDNTDCSPIADCGRRSILLDMITAHVAALAPAAASGGPVGNVTSATEGTVSVSFDAGSYPQSAAWWRQTQYGLSYYQATANKRTMRYFRGQSVPAAPPLYGVRRPWPL